MTYAYQARKLAERTGHERCGALPYGITRVLLFAHVFLVMLPARMWLTAAGVRPASGGGIAWYIVFAAYLVRRQHPGAVVAEPV